MDHHYSSVLKRLAMIALGFCLVLSGPWTLLAQSSQETIGFVINDSALMHVPVEIRNDFSLIPAYHFAQVSGSAIQVHSDKQLTLSKGDKALTLSQGSTCIQTPAGPVQLPVAPFSQNGHLYVPLRFLCDQLDIDIEWNAQLRSIALKLDQERQSLTPHQMLVKAQENSRSQGDYTVDSTLKTTIYFPEEILSSLEITGQERVRQAPYTAYLTQDVRDHLTGQLSHREYLVTQKQLFSKEGEGPWIASSLGINSLLNAREQIAGISFLEGNDLSEKNPVYSFADDRLYNNRDCHVINLYYSPAFYEDNLREFLPLFDNATDEGDLQRLFEGLSIQSFQTIYIEKTSLKHLATEIFEEVSLHVPEQEEAYARFHTLGKLLYKDQAFALPAGIPSLNY